MAASGMTCTLFASGLFLLGGALFLRNHLLLRGGLLLDGLAALWRVGCGPYALHVRGRGRPGRLVGHRLGDQPLQEADDFVDGAGLFGIGHDAGMLSLNAIFAKLRDPRNLSWKTAAILVAVAVAVGGLYRTARTQVAVPFLVGEAGP